MYAIDLKSSYTAESGYSKFGSSELSGLSEVMFRSIFIVLYLTMGELDESELKFRPREAKSIFFRHDNQNPNISGPPHTERFYAIPIIV